MRRFERRRVERRRRVALTVGLSFALGALTNEALTWRLQRGNGPAGQTARSATEAEPAHEPLEPVGVERRADDDEPQLATAGQTLEDESAIAMLRRRGLEFPVEGLDRAELRDTFSDTRGQGRSHEALDIMAPRGTPIHSAAAGRVLKLFRSVNGGLMVYAADSSERFVLMYAHLDRYAPGLTDSTRLVRGQVIGYVGSTGNASPNAPHLHFAVARSADVKRWSRGKAIDPLPILVAGRAAAR